MTEFNPMAVTGHNSDGAKKEVFAAIDSLYEEAAHWADGSEIENVQQHDAVTAIRTTLHDLGKKADDMRVAEKEPLDEAVKAIQAEFNPYIQPKKGKVDRAKSCLDVALGKWRIAEQKRKDEIARQEREEAEAELRAAQEAIRESSGNLLAREDAELALERAKETQKFARRAEKDATTKTGLRTVKRIEFDGDRGAGMDWAFEHDAERFFALAIDMAREYHSATKKCAVGFKVVEEKVAK
jgi:hypothetical protein